jgi:hypothetical protein
VPAPTSPRDVGARAARGCAVPAHGPRRRPARAPRLLHGRARSREWEGRGAHTSARALSGGVAHARTRALSGGGAYARTRARALNGGGAYARTRARAGGCRGGRFPVGRARQEQEEGRSPGGRE